MPEYAPLSLFPGSMRIQRAFDFGDSIDLARAHELLGEAASAGFLEHAGARRGAIVLRHAPLTVRLPGTRLAYDGTERELATIARLWDYGVVSITFTEPVAAGTPFESLAARTSALTTDAADAIVDAAARSVASALVERVREAVRGLSSLRGTARYFTVVLSGAEGLDDARMLLERADVPALLLGETDPRIAEDTRRAVLEHVFQYRPDDLVVVDVEGALVVEPAGTEEVTDVLELALTYLLEVDYYDEVVERRVDELYGAIGQRRHGNPSARARSHQASRIYLELSEVLERMAGSLEVVGDAYLARIFHGAIRRFGVPERKAAIDRRMHALEQTSELLANEAAQQWSWTLELVVIGLIAFEILLSLLAWPRP